ncbi:MAG: PilZ domain-containing protein, partial [Deltaproteobacteria bacterium]|nr:PilZ domain-containing protein [Deltaproteobacteria bacterium]
MRFTEKRDSTRFNLKIPVQLSSTQGMMRDISLSGVYLTTEQQFQAGEKVQFVFELDYAMPGRPVHFDCEGHVLRVEKLDDCYGIAAKIDE